LVFRKKSEARDRVRQLEGLVDECGFHGDVSLGGS
jgi:hypothetical protein